MVSVVSQRFGCKRSLVHIEFGQQLQSYGFRGPWVSGLHMGRRLVARVGAAVVKLSSVDCHCQTMQGSVHFSQVCTRVHKVLYFMAQSSVRDMTS